MQQGGWIPVDKSVARLLPRNRAFSELEALISLQLDYDQGNPVSVNGYSSLWGWSCGKIRRFLRQLGTEICYPEKTSSKQNQRGQINVQITNRSQKKRGQIRLINSKWLADKSNRSTDKCGQNTDRSPNTTIDPIEPNPKKNAPSTDALRLSGLLAELIAANNSTNRSIQLQNREQSINNWAIDIERMMRIDKRSVAEAEEVIRWCQNDSFWQINILSGKKLREHYDKLVPQMTRVCADNTGRRIVVPITSGRKVY